MKKLLRQCLTRTVSPLLRSTRRRRPAILMFHGFTDREHQGCENSQHKHLHVTKLEMFLAFLVRHYQVIPMDEMVHCLRERKSLPLRAIVLTFDDGFLSNYTLAYPLLQKFRVPAIIYLATEFVDEQKPIWTDRIDYAMQMTGKSPAELRSIKQRLKQLPQDQVENAVAELEESLGCGGLRRSNGANVPAIYHSLNWGQVREMQSSGLVQFGAHTHSHKLLGRCQPQVVRQELEISKLMIERETGSVCEHFCYPNGGPEDYSIVSEQILAEVGFVSSITTVGGWIARKENAFLLPRIGITNDLDLAQFDLLLSGFTAGMDSVRSMLKT